MPALSLGLLWSLGRLKLYSTYLWDWITLSWNSILRLGHINVSLTQVFKFWTRASWSQCSCRGRPPLDGIPQTSRYYWTMLSINLCKGFVTLSWGWWYGVFFVVVNITTLSGQYQPDENHSSKLSYASGGELSPGVQSSKLLKLRSIVAEKK